MSGFGILGTTKPSVDDIADVLEAGAGTTDLARVWSAASDKAVQADYDRYYRVAAWGDSFTDIGAPWFQNALPGFGVNYGGYTGETSTQIKTRMLARPDRFNDISIIWVGRNNFASPATVKADIAAMVAALTTPARYLIISVFNGTTEPSGSANYTTITTLNNELSVLYGANYLDARALLVAAYNPALPQDVVDHSVDVPPNSLRADTLHYNTAGAKLVASAVATWVASLTLATPKKLVEYHDIDALLDNSPAHNIINVAGDGVVRVGGAPVLQARINYNSFYMAGAYNYTATGANNFAIGTGALQKATTAGGCVAIGNLTLSKNLTGDGNLAVGDSALASLTTGYQNMALGGGAMTAATTAQQNVAIGYAALTSTVAGANNVAIGSAAMLGLNDSNTCVAVGSASMRNATYGFSSTAVGFGTLYKYAGAYATAVGASALGNTVAQFGQTAIGCEALGSGDAGANTVAVGYRAGKAATGNNCVFLGPYAGDKETGSSTLIIDVGSRATEAAARDLALVWGTFSTTAEGQRLKLNAPTRVLTTTWSALPSPTIGVGYRATITDAVSPVFGAVAVGGGATVSPVYCDGSSWRIG
jgi:lysophospholipase L1-like esterase